GLLWLVGCGREISEYLGSWFAGPVAGEDVLAPLRELVRAEAYEACTLSRDLRRAWAVERLRDLGITGPLDDEAARSGEEEARRSQGADQRRQQGEPEPGVAGDDRDGEE